MSFQRLELLRNIRFSVAVCCRFPTLFFAKAGSREPVVYDGEHTLEGLIEFVKEHASKPISVAPEQADHDEL